MRVSFQPKNFVATPIQSLPFDPHRTYLCVIAIGSQVEITISGGTPFSIPDGEQWAPIPAPMNALTFTGSGTLIVA